MGTIAVCVKWVDLRPEIDATTGAVDTDDRRRGFSDSDQAALEVGLRLAESSGDDVAVVSVAGAAAAPALEQLAASGASSIVHIEADGELPSSVVGASIAAAVEDLGDVELVVTGDHSLDRGSGSVPSFVAHRLGWAQALGLIAVGDGGRSAVRRLDGGRREHVSWTGPAVISVEGSIARLRRASLRSVMGAKGLPRTVAHVGDAVADVDIGPTAPLRPRARALPPPHGDRALSRIVELTGALVERTPPRRVDAEPAAAAVEIVSQLRAWGYLD